MADVFISYASEDREHARRIADALELLGWVVWWDRKIPIGRHYDDVISETLAEAKCVVTLWSRAGVASGWVREETGEAQRRGILVPVLVEEADIPLGFRRLQAAHLENWTGAVADPVFQDVVHAVAAKLGHSPPLLPVPSPPNPGRVPDVPAERAPSTTASLSTPSTAKARWRIPAAVGALLVLLTMALGAYFFAGGMRGTNVQGIGSRYSSSAIEAPPESSQDTSINTQGIGARYSEGPAIRDASDPPDPNKRKKRSASPMQGNDSVNPQGIGSRYSSESSDPRANAKDQSVAPLQGDNSSNPQGIGSNYTN